MICPICELGKEGMGNAYVHCPAYGLVHMSHCTRDQCRYHRYDISTDWCCYKTAKQKAGDKHCRLDCLRKADVRVRQ